MAVLIRVLTQMLCRGQSPYVCVCLTLWSCYRYLLLLCYRYLTMRGFGKRHTLAMANPIHEIPEELQQKLSLQPIRNRRPGGLLSPTERTSSKGSDVCRLLSLLSLFCQTRLYVIVAPVLCSSQQSKLQGVWCLSHLLSLLSVFYQTRLSFISSPFPPSLPSPYFCSFCHAASSKSFTYGWVGVGWGVLCVHIIVLWWEWWGYCVCTG